MRHASQYAKKPPGAWSSDGRYEKAEKKRVELFQQQVSDLDGLISVIPRASFGKRNETVYDTNIPDALQLKAENFEISIPQVKMDEILTEIKEQLALQTDVVAEPYSLNVYQKGGKFSKHKHTPRGDDKFGTLVICLPSWFVGRKMTVSLGSETETYFEYGQCLYGKSSPRDPCEIQWCAFFSDVDHEIHTIGEGIRITAAYLLRRVDHAPA